MREAINLTLQKGPHGQGRIARVSGYRDRVVAKRDVSREA